VAGVAYLVASGQDGVLEQVAARAMRELRAAGKERPVVAVSYAPVHGDARGLAFMSGRMPRLFPGAVLESFDGDRGPVDRADLVFVSGGDPTLGARRMRETGADGWVREARARGVPVMGVSAGSIVLGAWWADWGDEDDAGDDEGEATTDEGLARATLVECAGAVAGHVFDTHDEKDDWEELRAVAELLRRRGEEAVFLGIPTGGALVFDASGAIEVVGNPPHRLR
jgi:Peptidase family S51